MVIWSWASLRILIWSCIAETKRSILESTCSSRIFSILRAAATTSSSVRHPNFCISAASGRSNAPRNASITWRSATSSSQGCSRLASFSASPASSTISLEPFLRFFKAVQDSSFTEPMPKRDSSVSFAVSQDASSSNPERDAGSCGANEKLTPSDFMFILPNFTELESLLQLCQPIGQYMLPMVVLGHIVNN